MTPSAAQTGDDERVNLSQMRRTIARRMAESTRTVPHFFLTTTVDATEMVKLRKQILEQTATADSNVKITFNDLIVKAAALAIRQVPDVNVSLAAEVGRERRLRAAMDSVPLLYVPELFVRSHGLRSTRQIAEALSAELGY